MKLKKAFTIVELLTVLAVIALLVSLLVPSLNMARNAARVAKQRVQFNAIDNALLMWRNDFGDYPESAFTLTSGEYYCGSQKLAEAFFGLDLLGFNPNSKLDFDPINTPLLYPLNPTPADLSVRKKRYIELDSVDVFTVNNLYRDQIGQLAPNTYVICDVFGRINVNVGTKTKKVGPPVLYFKANPSAQYFSPGNIGNNVYEYTDNLQLIVAQMQFDENVNQIPAAEHKILNNFYDTTYKILDQKITNIAWPHRPDSYILISAGLDGYYGTSDDITNFGQ